MATVLRRGPLWGAWTRFLKVREHARMPDPELTPAQVREVEACVDAVVAGAPGRFFEPKGSDDDLYEWTRDYGVFGAVHLSPDPPIRLAG